jgi:hypothetical protein
MELIGFGITVAAVIWGATEVMKHFFPTWEESKEHVVRQWIHERIDGLEEDIDVVKKNIAHLIEKNNPPTA